MALVASQDPYRAQPPDFQGVGGAGLNLSSMKSVENAIRKTAERAAESGGVVETQTITLVEHLGAEQVPTMVGVERKAWLLQHERFATGADRDNHAKGWSDCLDRLPAWLAI